MHILKLLVSFSHKCVSSRSQRKTYLMQYQAALFENIRGNAGYMACLSWVCSAMLLYRERLCAPVVLFIRVQTIQASILECTVKEHTHQTQCDMDASLQCELLLSLFYYVVLLHIPDLDVLLYISQWLLGYTDLDAAKAFLDWKIITV